MYRWTTSTQIPLPNSSKYTKTDCYCTIIGRNIWVMVYFDDANATTQGCMFVMDTNTNKIYNVEYNHEVIRLAVVQGFTSDGPNLYMICRNALGIDGQLEYTIYVMDTTKKDLEWHELLVFTFDNDLENCLIIGKTLYILSEDPIKLIVIDLSHKNPMKIVEVVNEDTITDKGMLMKNNDTLYIVVQEDLCRTVLILENEGELRVVKVDIDIYDNDESTLVENGNRVLYTQDSPQSIELDTYNFVNNEWTRRNVGTSAQNQTLKSALEHDDKIYIVIRSNWHNGHQHDIRVLDMKPNLSSICWLNVVDEVVSRGNTDQVQDIRKQLPGILQSQMDAVVNWRIAEKEKNRMRKLSKKRFTQMIDKINEMCDDGEITEEQETEFFDLFKREDLAYIADIYDDGSEEDDSDME